MSFSEIVTVDFETEGIKRRPEYPPKPVGVAIKIGGKKSVYMSWGHPEKNNCTFKEAKKELKRLLNFPMLFHNCKFDLEVMKVSFGLFPKEYHDTMFLSFLHNPHERILSLKPLSEKYLDMPPEEQEAVRDWLFDNRPDLTIGKSRKTWKGWGAYICEAPGDLVGKYARGDVDRTYKLFKLFYKNIKNRNMLIPYQRELALVPILIKNESEGVCINHKLLRKDIKKYTKQLTMVDDWFGKSFFVKEIYDKDGKAFIDSGPKLADALESAGLVDKWIYTSPSKNFPNGQRSTSKDNIKICIKDKEIIKALDYRGKLALYLRTFMRPWLEMADRSGGRIFTNWNQTRNEGGGGARTGRFSSNPNFQNVPRTVEAYIGLPAGFPMIDLPYIRKYIVADSKDHILINRDYSQQELRILGHFENGVLMEEYQNNPTMDIHAFALKMLNEILNSNFGRLIVKKMGFGLVYGMGIALLAQQMDVDEPTAKKLKSAYLEIFPGLGDLDKELKQRGRRNEPIRTWGGREYYVEVARNGRTFEYKLLNVLIQGSAADCTKQALLNTSQDPNRPNIRFLLSVHDELMFSVHKDYVEEGMVFLKNAMESVKFDVPMLSDGKTGYSWGKMKEYKDVA